MTPSIEQIYWLTKPQPEKLSGSQAIPVFEQIKGLERSASQKNEESETNNGVLTWELASRTNVISYS